MADVQQQLRELQAQYDRLAARLPAIVESTEPAITNEFARECSTYTSASNSLRKLAIRDSPPEDSPLAPVALPPQLVAVADARHVAYRSEHDTVNGLQQAAWLTMRALAALREARTHGNVGSLNFCDQTLITLFGALTFEAEQHTKSLVGKICKDLKLPIHVSSLALDAVGTGDHAEFNNRLGTHLTAENNDRNFQRLVRTMANTQQQQQQQHRGGFRGRGSNRGNGRGGTSRGGYQNQQPQQQRQQQSQQQQQQ
ncbi:hypothetical protein GGI08_002669 [Coemansia sp. S2]|nr:hypothetical protein GGI08_002669 [Coemansia sp. S2]